MYCIETAARPNLSMLASEDPKSVKILESFHRALGRPESFLTFGPDCAIGFSLHIAKGQTLKDALTQVAKGLTQPLVDAPDGARSHVPGLLANL